jgi:hypothetical protein
MRGAIDPTGLTPEHWLTSSIAFTVIVITIVLKLFIETNFWNWLSIATGLFCIALYIATVLVLNTHPIAILIQPEIENQYWIMLMTAKAWILMILLPLVVLIPDMCFMMF